MNNLKVAKEDGLPRLLQLLVMAPIGIATMLVLASSLILVGSSGLHGPALALGIAAIAMIAAAAVGWFVMDRFVSAALRDVAAFLRAAKNGTLATPPSAFGGVLQDIVDLTTDIIETQVHVGRFVVGLQSVEDLTHTIDDFTRTTKSDHAAMSRAIMALAGDVKKGAAPGLDGALEAFVGQVETSMTTMLAKHDRSSDLKSELEAVRRRIDATHLDTKAVSLAIDALRTDVRTGATKTVAALHDTVKSNIPSHDTRPDVILERIQSLGSDMIDRIERKDVAAKADSPGLADYPQARLIASFNKLQGDVTRQVAMLGERVDQTLAQANLGQTATRIESAAQGLDGLAKDIGAADISTNVAVLKNAVREIKQLAQDVKSYEAERARIAHDERVSLASNNVDAAKAIVDLRSGLDGMFARIDALAATSGNPAAVSAALSDLRAMIVSQGNAVRSLSGQVHQGVETILSSQTTQDVGLHAHLDRVGQQVDHVTVEARKASSVIDAVADIRQAIGAQTEKTSAQTQTVDGIAAGVERALFQLADLTSTAGKPVLATSKDLVDGLSAVQTALAAIEAQVIQGVAVSNGETAGRLHDGLDQIRDQLHAVTAGTANTSVILERIAHLHEALATQTVASGAQAETVGTIASGLSHALTLLTDLAATEGKPIPATADELSRGLDAMAETLAVRLDAMDSGIKEKPPATATELFECFEGIKTFLVTIETRVEDAVAIAQSNLAAHEAKQAFAALHHSLDQIDGALKAGVQHANVTILDTMAEVQQRIVAQGETITNVAAAVDRALDERKPVEDQSGAEAVRAFATVQETLGVIGDQIRVVDTSTAQTQAILDTLVQVRDAITTQGDTVKVVAGGVDKALFHLYDLTATEGKVAPASANDLAEGFAAVKASLSSIETRVVEANAQSASRLSVDKADQVFVGLRETLHAIGDQLQAVESNIAAKADIAADSLREVRQAFGDHADATGARADIAAASMADALVLLTDLAARAGQADPATRSDLSNGLDAIKATLWSIETRLEQAVTLSGSALTSAMATDAFEMVRGDLDKVSGCIQTIMTGTTKTADLVEAVGVTQKASGVRTAIIETMAGNMWQAITTIQQSLDYVGVASLASKADIIASVSAVDDHVGSLDARIGEVIALTTAAQTADHAMHAFAQVREALGLIDSKIDGVEVIAARTSTLSETILDVRHVLNAQADTVAAQGETMQSVVSGLDQALTLLTGMNENDEHQKPLVAPEIVAGFDTIRTTLGLIEARVEHAIATTETGLSDEKATRAFESLHGDFTRLGERLGRMESGSARAATALDTILTMNVAKPSSATVLDVSRGFEAITTTLGILEGRMEHAVALSEAALAADHAGQGLASLNDNIKQIGEQLQALDTGTATRTSIVLDSIADIHFAVNTHAAAAVARSENAGSVAAGIVQTLSRLIDSVSTEGKPMPATARDLSGGIDAIKAALGAIETRMTQAFAMSASSLTEDKAVQAFASLRDHLNQIGDQLLAVGSDAQKTALVLETATDVREGLRAFMEAMVQGHAETAGTVASGIRAVADGVGTVAARVDASLALLGELTSNEGKSVPTTRADLVEFFHAIKGIIVALEKQVKDAATVSGSALSADKAAQAFEGLRDTLGRISDQLHALEAVPAKADTLLHAVDGVRQVASAQSDVSRNQTEAIGGIMRGIGEVSALLRELTSGEGKPLPASVTAEHFDAVKAALAAITMSVGEASAIAGSALTTDQAGRLFDRLRETVERIAEKLESVQRDTAHMPVVLDTLGAVEGIVRAQSEMTQRAASETWQGLTSLGASMERAKEEALKTTGMVSSGFEGVDTKLGTLEVLAGSMGQIGARLQTLESETAKASSALDAIRIVPSAVADQAKTVTSVAADVRQALTILTAPTIMTNDPPATAADLLGGLEAVHERLALIAARVDVTVAAAGAAQSNEASRVAETAAATQRLMDAILTVRGLLNAQPAAMGDAEPGRLMLRDDGLTRFDEIAGRLDHLAERLDLFVDDVPALSRAARPSATEASANRQDDFALVFDTGLLSRIDDLAARLDGITHTLEGMDQRQGMMEPIVKGVIAPVVDRVGKLAELNEEGFARLAGHFGQLTDAMSAVPQATARETSALMATSPVDLSSLHRRFDDLREGLDDLAGGLEAMPQRDAVPSPVGRTSSNMLVAALDDRSFAGDPTQFIGAEMDALHSRFDQLAARIEQLAHVVNAGRQPFDLASSDAAPPAGIALETVSRDVLQRLDDLRAMLAKVGMAELPPVVQRLETSNRTLVNVITEWRAAGSPLTREMLEEAVEGLNRQLHAFGGTETIMLAINELRSGLQQSLPAPGGRAEAVVPSLAFGGVVADLHARFDDIAARVDRLADVEGVVAPFVEKRINQSAAALRGEIEATVVPIRELTKMAESALSRLEAKADETLSDRHASRAEDAAQSHVALADVRARLDSIQAHIDAFTARIETLKHPDLREDILVSRLDQSNQAIAETLLGFESRFEQPLADLREGIAAARSAFGAPPPAASGSARDDGGDDDERFGAPNLVAALRTMGGFMAAIEDRFTAVETMAQEVSAGAPDPNDHAHLALFNDGISEMRRLTHEFLDISCAISDELATHAKPQAVKMARAM